MRFGRVASEAGIGPVRLLKERSREVRLLSWLRKLGTDPEMLVQLMDKYVSFLSLVMARGMGPTKLLCLRRTRVSRNVRLPICGGI